MSPGPRHGNRLYRTRSNQPPPDRTLAGSVAGGEEQSAGPRGAHRPSLDGSRNEALLLGAAGLVLPAGLIIGSPWVSLLTIPAALLAPGQLVLRLAAARFIRGLDPWFLWPLRLVASLAVWTVLGALFALVADPRWLAAAVGPSLLLAALAMRAAARGVVGPPAPGAAAGTAIPVPPGARRRHVARGLLPRGVAVLGVFAVVAAACLAVGHRLATSGPGPVPYVAMDVAGPTGPGYDGSGAIRVTVEVRNATAEPRTIRLRAAVDRRSLVQRRVRLTAGQVYRLPITSPGGCWTRLAVTATDLPADLAPRPLVLWGPSAAPNGCAGLSP